MDKASSSRLGGAGIGGGSAAANIALAAPADAGVDKWGAAAQPTANVATKQQFIVMAPMLWNMSAV